MTKYQIIAWITGPHAKQKLQLLNKNGELWSTFPEFIPMLEPHDSPYHMEEDETGNTIWAHTRLVFNYACDATRDLHFRDRLIIRLAALFHDSGKPFVRVKKERFGQMISIFNRHDQKSAEIAEKRLSELGFLDEITGVVSYLCGHHMRFHDLSKMKDVAKIKRMIGCPCFRQLRILCEADENATVNSATINPLNPHRIGLVCNNYLQQYGRLLPAPIITNLNLIKAGLPSKHFEKALQVTYDQQLRGQTDFNKLLKFAVGYVKTKEKEN